VKKLKESLNSESEFLINETKLNYELPENEHIIKYQDYFIDELNYLYLVLEYCDGGSLNDKIEKAKIKFSIEQITQWSKEMIMAIHFLHSHNIIHRDIKPA
jgi:serine/threonine protein kinase